VRPFAFADIKFKRPCFYETNKQFRETFNLGIPLGSGSTSCVRRCENRERANSKCAKMINIDNNREVLNEYNILKKIYHPLIVDIHEVLEEPKKLYIIEELCMGGDVAHALQQRPCYSEEEASHIIKGALIALNYCHQKNVIHRNIKPGNFVFKKTGNKMAKLIDFGSAIDLNSKNQKEKLPLSKIIGQPLYMAPEVLKECYNEKADLWSLGVMMYELLSNKSPFDATSDQELMQ
jgi:calcium-dependent protein kinase